MKVKKLVKWLEELNQNAEIYVAPEVGSPNDPYTDTDSKAQVHGIGYDGDAYITYIKPKKSNKRR